MVRLSDSPHRPAANENFLLIIAYWLGPWLGVVLVDQLLRRSDVTRLLYDQRHTNWAGPVAMVVGMAVSIPLFSNQVKYTATLVKHHPGLGDITFEVGFVLAALLYAALFTLTRRDGAR